MTTYPIAEHEHAINNVPGRMYTVHEPQEIRGNMVHRNQTWKSTARPISGYGTNGQITVTIRFDDECKNGHQSFSITADVVTDESRRRKDIAAGGCLHEDIAAVFPELAPLIKWHLVSTDGPMHYLGNTLYHAGDRDYNGRRAGEPATHRTVIYFADSHVSHPISDKLAAFIQDRTAQHAGEFRVIALSHPDNGKPGKYQFDPKYTFVGYGEKWHECPFDDETTAQQWALALNTGSYHFERIVTSRSEGKPRDLDAARNAACWPEATDEELSADRDTLKAELESRLPALIAEFRADMERIGFLWEPTR
jgi:hypothetical protein